MSLSIIVLAAGQGKRMHSSLPKVLHRLAGRPLLAHVLQAARRLDPARTVVVHGYGGADIRSAFADADVTWVEQAAQQGTGHAVVQALPEIPPGDDVLILYGDVPLIGVETLRQLVQAARGGLAILTADAPDPSGYGRVVRGAQSEVLRVVEQRDATAAELELREVNAGFLCAPAKRLSKWLGDVRNHNAQKEYYLTDVVALAVSDRVAVAAVKARDWAEVTGVNSKRELAALEREVQRREAARLLEAGVTLADPARVDVRGSLECGRDVVLDVNCLFEGRVRLGDGVRVGPNCVLRNVSIAAETEVLAFSMLEDAEIGRAHV